MSSVNNFKASIIIGGEIGASFRKALRGTAKETNLVGDEFKRLQKIVAQTDRAIGYKEGRTRISEKTYKGILDDLQKAGVKTGDLANEQRKYTAELKQTEAKLQKVNATKKSVAQLGAAWASVTKSVKTASLALGVFTAAGYGIYRFTKSVVDFNGSARVFRDFNYTLLRLRYNIAYALMPAVTEALGQLSQFFTENKEAFTNIAREVGNSIRQMTPFFMGLLRLGLAVGRVLAGISRLLPGWVKFGGLLAVSAVSATVFTYKVITLGKAIYSTLVPAVGLLTGAVEWLGTVMAATPVGWVLAIGAAIVGVAYLIYRNWNPLKTFFRKLFTEPIQSVKELFHVIRDYTALVTHSPGKLWSAAKGGTQGVGGTVKGTVGVMAFLNALPAMILGTFFHRLSESGNASLQSAPVAKPKQTASLKPQVSQTNHITINAAPGQSPEQIAEAVLKKIDQRGQQLARLSPSTAFAFA